MKFFERIEVVYMNKDSKIYVAGHRGMVGSAIVRNLEAKGYTNIIGRTSKELNLMRQEEVEKFFEEERPDESFAQFRQRQSLTGS
jgi:GDP-L-fucose synthase